MPYVNWFRFLVGYSVFVLLGIVWDLGGALLGMGDLLQALERDGASHLGVWAEYGSKVVIASVVLFICYHLFARAAWAPRALLATLGTVHVGYLALGLAHLDEAHAVVYGGLTSSSPDEKVLGGLALCCMVLGWAIYVGVPLLTWYFLSRPSSKEWLGGVGVADVHPPRREGAGY